MSESDILVPYDFDQLQWQSLQGSDRGRKRPLSGGETAHDTFNRYHKGHLATYFGAYVDMLNNGKSISESKLITAARDTWIWLRYHIPTIAAHVEIDESDKPWLVYGPEKSTEGLKNWADRTFVVHEQEKIDLDEIRNQIEGRKIPSEDGDQTWMHFVPGSSRAGVFSFGMLFHSHHAPFDGTALKIIFNRYLTHLVNYLGAPDSEPVHESLEWGQESVNLLPPVFNILAPSEPRPLSPDGAEKPSFAHPYYAAVGKVLGDIAESLQNPYTFRPRPVHDKWPVVRRVCAQFSKEESTKIMSCLKPCPSKRYTLTHLAHAALVMTLMADNPPTPEAASQNIYNISLANCRSSLREPFNTREGYPGYVLGVYLMKFPVSLLLDEAGRRVSLDKTALVKSIRALRTAYEEQKRTPSAISFMAQTWELFCVGYKRAVLANQLPPNQGFWFSSDGPGENCLDPAYSDVSGAHVFSINRFFTAVDHTDPGPFFRIWSWRGVIELSIDFNSNSISSAEVAKHMDTWRQFMLLVQDFGEADY